MKDSFWKFTNSFPFLITAGSYTPIYDLGNVKYLNITYCAFIAINTPDTCSLKIYS